MTNLKTLGFEERDVERLRVAYNSSAPSVEGLVDRNGALWNARLMCLTSIGVDFFELEMVKSGLTCDVTAQELFA